MRKLTAVVIFLVLMLAACRPEAERSAMAQAASGDLDVRTSAPAVGGSDIPSVRLRRLWGGSGFNSWASSPSPDGRWVTDIDWSTGDLAVRDLTTGRLHRLTDKGPWTESGDYAEVSSFSPDGRRVVYGWYVAETDAHDVRVLDFSVDETGVPRGSDPRVVHPGVPLMPYWMYGWTSVNEVLTGVYRPGNTTALGLLSLSTGELRLLKSFDWRDAHAVVSADGRFIAYDHPPGPDPRDRDIYLLSTDGSLETTLVEGPGRDLVLGWVPNGGSLLFYSERSGIGSVWRLPMADGRPTGTAELLREDMRNLEPLGFAGEDFYFGVQVETPTFQTATIDFEGRRLAELPTTFGAPYGGGPVQALAWSPDGEHVIHDVSGPASTWIYLRTAAGDVVKEWNFDLVLRANPAFARFAPDGRSVWLPAIDGRGRGGFFRIDLESGELELIRRFDHRGLFGRSFSFSPDGRTLYFTGLAAGAGRPTEEDENLLEIVAHDLETGNERSIHRVRHRGSVVASPDGAVLAYHELGPDPDPTIQLFPVEGGEPRILHRVEDPGRPGGILGWTPDAASLLFLVQQDLDEFELWTVSRDDGEAERIAAIPKYAGGYALHEGRMLAYRAGEWRGEIWAMEGLNPSIATVTPTDDAR